jgi:hypothetical protein
MDTQLIVIPLIIIMFLSLTVFISSIRRIICHLLDIEQPKKLLKQ